MKRITKALHCRYALIAAIFCCLLSTGFGQVGINTNDPDSSSIMDISSNRTGLLVPRLKYDQRNDLLDKFVRPAHSLLVYDSTHQYFYFLDTRDLTGHGKGTWKAMNPWTLRGTNTKTNHNPVYYLGDVGIGTDAPVSELEVVGTSTSRQVTATTRVNTNLIKVTEDGENLKLYDWNNKGIFIENGGRVGINNTNPNDRLDVEGDVDVNGGYKLKDKMLLTADEEDNFYFGWGIHRDLSTTVSRNTIIGTGTASTMTEGYGNVLIGYHVAQLSKDNMHGNVMIGTEAGQKTISAGTNDYVLGNVYIGTEAGKECVGVDNIFIGDGAGRNKPSGYDNICMGNFSGQASGTGWYNIMIGDQSGQMMGDGQYNLLVGSGAGLMADGDGNIAIGLRAGFLSEGNSISIGNEAGGFGSNKLSIGNGPTSIIEGDMSVPELTINGDLTVTGACSGCSSDSTLKTNIKPLGSSLEKIARLKGYTFDWKPSTRQYQTQPGPQIGLMAQEVQVQFPTLVGRSNEGHLYVDYQKMVVPLVESVKELNEKLEVKDKEIEDLKARLARIENYLVQQEASSQNVQK